MYLCSQTIQSVVTLTDNYRPWSTQYTCTMDPYISLLRATFSYWFCVLVLNWEILNTHKILVHTHLVFFIYGTTSETHILISSVRFLNLLPLLFVIGTEVPIFTFLKIKLDAY